MQDAKVGICVFVVHPILLFVQNFKESKKIFVCDDFFKCVFVHIINIPIVFLWIKWLRLFLSDDTDFDFFSSSLAEKRNLSSPHIELRK